MGGQLNRRIDEAGEHHALIVLRPLPRRIRIAARQRAVAGEGELAAARALRSLKDDIADALGAGGVADAVDDDLSDRELPLAVVTRLVTTRPRHSLAAPGPGSQVARLTERHGRPETQANTPDAPY